MSTNWCFTLSNFTDGDVDRITALVKNDENEPPFLNNQVKYLLFSKEVVDDTPFLQGFISFTEKVTMDHVKTVIGGFVTFTGNKVKTVIGGTPHVEVAQRTRASIAYFKKDGNFVEVGNFY